MNPTYRLCARPYKQPFFFPFLQPLSVEAIPSMHTVGAVNTASIACAHTPARQLCLHLTWTRLFFALPCARTPLCVEPSLAPTLFTQCPALLATEPVGPGTAALCAAAVSWPQVTHATCQCYRAPAQSKRSSYGQQDEVCLLITRPGLMRHSRTCPVALSAAQSAVWRAATAICRGRCR